MRRCSMRSPFFHQLLLWPPQPILSSEESSRQTLRSRCRAQHTRLSSSIQLMMMRMKMVNNTSVCSFYCCLHSHTAVFVDQFSEEGEENKTGPSPKKMPKSGQEYSSVKSRCIHVVWFLYVGCVCAFPGASLNFGVSTLEEIRLRKALKASMKKAGYPIQSAETSSTREKENIGLIYRTTLSESTGETKKLIL